MKGTIEFTQGAVLYIIIMLLVIVIGVAIVTKGQFIILFQGGKISQLFEPGAVKIGSGQENQPLSDINLDIYCGPSNVYDVTVKGIAFDYTSGGDKVVKFYVVLTLRNTIFPAVDEDGNPHALSCTPDENQKGYNCEGAVRLNFHARTDEPASKEFFHFTIWKAEPGVENILELPDGADDKTLSNLLNSQFVHYMGSFDIGGTVEGACLSVKCKGLDTRQCEQENGCWLKPGFLGLLSSCRGCLYASSCSEYKDSIECSKCGAYLDLGCHWDLHDNVCSSL